MDCLCLPSDRSFKVDEFLHWFAKVSHEMVHFNSLQWTLGQNIEMLPNFIEVSRQVILSSLPKQAQVSSKHLNCCNFGLSFWNDEMTSWKAGILISCFDSEVLNHFFSESVSGLSFESLWNHSLVGFSPITKCTLVSIEFIISWSVRNFTVFLLNFRFLNLDKFQIWDIGDATIYSSKSDACLCVSQ